MIAVRRSVLVCAALLCCCASNAQVARAEVRPQPMIFFVAKGAPNACGPGCSEWIAAEGEFDRGGEQRLRELLGSLQGRDLPIFFNSPGGIIGEARVIGRILRERRMKAGVGRTFPERCPSTGTADESCRSLIQSKQELKAQLRTAGAYCNSACVYAFLGASVREVPADARMGIHASRRDPDLPRAGEAKVEDVHAGRKRYVLEMGADPGLVDVAQKIPFDRARVMSRDEIARFGIETRGFYETPWMLFNDTSQRLSLLKSVTQAKGTGSIEYRTGVIYARCEFTSWILFFYQRELRSNEIGVASSIRLTAGGRDFESDGRERNAAIQASYVFTDLEFFRNAMSASEIVITESFSSRANAQSWSSVTKLSTKGLAEILGDWLKRCAEPKTITAPRAGGGR